MKVTCVGTDTSLVERTQLAVCFWSPDASFSIVSSQEEALAQVQAEAVDLVVLAVEPLGVPAFCAALRGGSDVPLMVLTDAGQSPLDEVNALNAGADEYVLAQVGLPELVARMVSLMRRATDQDVLPAKNILPAGDILLNPSTHQVLLANRSVDLTATEFDLLHVLVRSKGPIVSHRSVEQVLRGKWGHSSGLVKRYMERLRRKVDVADDRGHEYIRTIPSAGYRFVPRRPAWKQVEEATPT